MKILLFGADGQVGWELQRSLAPLGELVMPSRSGSGDLAGDFNHPEQLAATVRTLQPAVIVNAAAHTAVDKAESEVDAARGINALAPGELAKAAAACGALLVHYSTDYVFNGSGSRPWRETDEPAPLSVYGRTKLEGERLVQAHCPAHLILRTSWVYGTRGGNFMKTMLRLAGERVTLRVVDDQHGAPTGAELLADVTGHMVRATLADASKAGVYHAVAGGETTWNGYARLVIGQAAQLGMKLRASPEAVERVGSDAFPTPARRPLNSRLDTRKLREAFGLVLPDWRVGVTRAVDEIVKAS